MTVGNQKVSVRAAFIRALNRHQTSYKPIVKAASPALNRLVNHKATESTVLPKGAEQ